MYGIKYDPKPMYLQKREDAVLSTEKRKIATMGQFVLWNYGPRSNDRNADKSASLEKALVLKTLIGHKSYC